MVRWIVDGPKTGKTNATMNSAIGITGLGAGLFEPVVEAFPPIVDLGREREGCKESIAGDYTAWNPFEPDESTGSVPAIGVTLGRETDVTRRVLLAVGATGAGQ